MKFSRILLCVAVFGSAVGCSGELQGPSFDDTEAVSSNVNNLLRGIGEPELCALKGGQRDATFRMIEMPSRGQAVVIAVFAGPDTSVLRSTVVDVDRYAEDNLSVASRFELSLDEADVTKLWRQIDSSRLWGRRTGLSDVEDGKYVVFDMIGFGAACQKVILLSPDSAGVLELMEALKETADRLTQRRNQ